MEEVDIIKFTIADNLILKKVLGERIYYFYTEHLRVEAVGKEVSYWAPEYALGLKVNRSDVSFINISADHSNSDKSATTYFKFEVGESKAPLRKEKLLQSGQYSEIKLYSSPVIMIEIYQDWNKEFEEKIMYDAALVFYTESNRYLLKVREQLIGGVDIIIEEATIETMLSDLKLRQTLV
ncbi:hypothetical protein [Pontibacter harenae]|uniref:hypothetical protein n=1 Tax=Pontibacter harenae TaxID=2894083 RepID=UPI001E40B953|nr:hypothetical protein [Pontibacter harenae]MCC9167346.1 hypothetical protein [Pontibacter harenae]